ncbi:hypothetical protein SAPIO_CDS7492 [Scedosporium apiospermum]|uniref:DUF4238 domain-containing protein n=1 Tax=Pseudallescheria apiosperma TaxID=563466 RepID=A0A084G211_PSEDA|nr:uncharacterized protein SAPIO_CDS7492 [Scedosporium apiospermum]KEZ41373.1 hypothetical protein SAPIO_CDS7492 [Scedosporium apiospermum]
MSEPQGSLPAPASGVRSQYQHFVPQFLLKNFAHKYAPPDQDNTDSNKEKKNKKNKKKKQKGQKYEKGMYPGDPVVYNLDLEQDVLSIQETPVGRILGEVDMYRDPDKPTKEQQRIEEKFRGLERTVCGIFRRMVKELEDSKRGVMLTRLERDLVRKFLFLLKYRGPGFRRRFNHSVPDTYSENDRVLILEYMEKRGYSRPLDVWFEGLGAIIDLDMNKTTREWTKTLMSTMFFPDAVWFASHIDMSFMALCTVADDEDEYVLTDHSYNVFEGPNSFVRDPKTGKIEGGACRRFHEFAPISPKLMLVLRSNDLPYRGERLDHESRQNLRRVHEASLQQWAVQPKSILHSLPVGKAETSNPYIIYHGKVQPEWKPKKDDRCRNVVFGTREGFFRILEDYMTSTTPHHKVLGGDTVSSGRRLLGKFEALLKALGSEGTCYIPPEEPTETVDDYDKFMEVHIQKNRYFTELLQDKSREFKVEELLEHIPEASEYVDLPEFRKAAGRRPKPPRPSGLEYLDLFASKIDEFYEMMPQGMEVGGVYGVLGGHTRTIFYDMNQALRMLVLRIKIDAWSHGIDERTRVFNREYLTNLYLHLPPRRFYFYLQLCRRMHADEPDYDIEISTSSNLMPSPEECIAMGK